MFFLTPRRPDNRALHLVTLGGILVGIFVCISSIAGATPRTKSGSSLSKRNTVSASEVIQKKSSKKISLKKSAAAAPVSIAKSSALKSKKYAQSEFRGWDFIANRLRADGVSAEQLRQVYGNSQMPAFTEIPFGLNPKESHRDYSSFFEPEKLALAEAFIEQHREEFVRIEEELGVSRYVVSSILLVETQFGKILGRELVIYRLSRLASAVEPKNVALNTARLRKEDPSITLDAVQKRAEYLFETFYPELPALFTLNQDHGVNPFELRGSGAGAFGIPQFLPSSFLKYGKSAYGSSRASLFDPSDAAWSAANYLKLNGWSEQLDLASKRQVIWTYNRSDPYIDTVLGIARMLEERAYLSPPSERLDRPSFSLIEPANAVQ